MTAKALLAEAEKLAVEERIELVEAIWDSIAADTAALPLSQEHRDELERRLADFEAHPETSRAWEEVYAELGHRRQ